MDTDQLSEHISGIVVPTITIMVYVLFCLWAFGITKFKYSLKDLEYIEIGRSYNTPREDLPKPVKKEKVKVKVKKAKVKKAKKAFSPLQEDCVLALNAVGVKKSTARTEVKNFFNSKSVDTVEEFLSEYLKK